jgi:hypothetical protein
MTATASRTTTNEARYSEKVSYGQNEEYFTVENLNDLAINMYLKRRDCERGT